MDASGANGLGIIRGLAEKGLHSLALDHRANAIGFASRYATGLKCPDPHTSSEDFASFLAALGQEMPGKGVLLITHDTYLAEVTMRASELAPFFYFTAPPWPILRRVMDKKIQYQTAMAHGIAVPRTFFLDDTPPDQIDPRALAWPAIVKARFGKSFNRATGRQVLIAHSMEEVQAGYEEFDQFGLMLQEIIPGEDDRLYTFGSCLGRSGEALASFTGRKLRQHPVGFGTALVAERTDTPELAEQGTRLLRALDFFGPSQIEFKLDPRDGQFKLVEVNARFWKWHSLAAACGANVAYAAYCDAIGDLPEQQAAIDVHKVWTMALNDWIITGRRVLHGAYPFRSLCETYMSPFLDGVFCWGDPLPGAALLWHKLRRRWSHLLQRLQARAFGQPPRASEPTASLSDALSRAELTSADGSDQ
jgi:predicted ATP-grasp superfamily ATP-dependent carboligase